MDILCERQSSRSSLVDTKLISHQPQHRLLALESNLVHIRQVSCHSLGADLIKHLQISHLQVTLYAIWATLTGLPHYAFVVKQFGRIEQALGLPTRNSHPPQAVRWRRLSPKVDNDPLGESSAISASAFLPTVQACSSLITTLVCIPLCR